MDFLHQQIIGTKFSPNGGGSGTGVAGDGTHVAGTSRFRIDMPAYDVVLRSVSYWNGRISFNSAGEIAGANQINVKAAWEPDGASAVIPFAFSGLRTGTLDPAVRLQTDPAIDLIVPGGSKPWIRQFVSIITPGQTWPVNRIAHASALGESDNVFGTGAGTDQVDAVGTFGNATATYSFGPCGIYGIPANGSRQRCVALFQDSIGTVSGEDASPGYGDDNGYAGYLERAIQSQIATVNCARATSRLQWVAGGFENTLALVGPYVTSAIIQLGVNDWSTGRTSNQMLGDLATIVGRLKAFGVRVFVCTSTPKPTATTNGWKDGGSALSASDHYRAEYNDRVRLLPFGIDGVFDVAAQVEDPNRPGYWIAAPTPYTLDGTHLLAAGRMAAIQAIDLNRLV